MPHLYLAPYVGVGIDDDPFRPRGAEQPGWSAIDLRPDCTVLTGRALLSVPVRDDTIGTYLGDAPDEVSATVKSAIQSRFGITLEATRLRQIIPELLIAHAREDGTRWRPLRAMRDGVFRIYLSGLWWQTRSLSGGSTITESFNKANNGLGPDLTWTVTSGAWSVVSNQAQATGAGAHNNARADSDLTADHYVVVSVISLDANRDVGVIGRYASAANSGYVYLNSWNGSTGQCVLYKNDGGSYTSLASDIAHGTPAGNTLRLECDGSSMTGLFAGSTHVGPTTDTTFQTQTRCGIRGFAASPTVDNFEAGDLVVSVSLTDSVSLGLSETDALLARLTLAESLPLPLTDTLDLRAAFQLSETLGLGLTETDAVLARLNLADLSEVGLVDAASILGGMTVSDAVALGIIDRETILAQIPLADVAALGLDDVLLLRALLQDLSDAMGVGIQESVSVAQAMTLALSDTFGLTGIEALTLGVSAVLADTVAINVAETLDLLSTFTVSDGIALTASDALSLLARFSVGDTAALGLQDSIAVNPLIEVALQLADSCGLGVAEAVTVTAGLLLADSCGLTLAEVLDILEALAPALLLFDRPVRLLGGDDRRVALVGGDNRQAALVGGDDRRVALVGGPPRP